MHTGLASREQDTGLVFQSQHQLRKLIAGRNAKENCLKPIKDVKMVTAEH